MNGEAADPWRFLVLASLLLLAAILLPRLLVLYMVYLDLGIGIWFVIHLVVTLMVWGGSGGYHSRRYRSDD